MFYFRLLLREMIIGSLRVIIELRKALIEPREPLIELRKVLIENCLPGTQTIPNQLKKKYTLNKTFYFPGNDF
jgi:hypothetical protein